MSTKTRVMVYGSLLSGLHNHDAFLKDARLIGACGLTGRYVMLDLGAFPAVLPVADAPEMTIACEVYEVDAEEQLASLDMLEGHPNFYKREKVLTTFGNKAWIYFLTSDQEETMAKLGQDYTLVPDGDWRAHYNREAA